MFKLLGAQRYEVPAYAAYGSVDGFGGSPDCLSVPGKREDSELHPTTKSFRSTAHSRSPPLSVTTNDSEIAAPKSSSHIPDWK